MICPRQEQVYNQVLAEIGLRIKGSFIEFEKGNEG
jgi:hypothetical protein